MRNIFLEYGSSLEELISSKTSQNFESFLLQICKGNRDESGVTNLDAAKNDAKQLYSVEDDSVFIDILGSRSFQQIKLVKFS